MVSAWTCDSLSWFQSTVVCTKKGILKLFNVGCRYSETSGVVGYYCWTKFDDTWSGMFLG